MPDSYVTRRQDALKVYDVVPIFYIVTPKRILDYETYFKDNIISVIILKEYTINIDNKLDFLLQRPY